MIHINSSPEAPPPRIRILDTRAREVETVRIGDRLTFRIEIPEDSKFRFERTKLHQIFSNLMINSNYYRYNFQRHIAYLLVHVWPWPRIQRVHSKLLTMKDVQLIQQSSLVSHQKQMHCNPFMKRSVSPKAMVLSSNVM